MRRFPQKKGTLTASQKQLNDALRQQKSEAQHRAVLNQVYSFPPVTTEHMFHPSRKWRFDYAWIEEKIALEIHGSVWTGGRHTQGSGYTEDRIKMNEAQLLGWIVIEVPSDKLNTINDLVKRAFEVRAND